MQNFIRFGHWQQFFEIPQEILASSVVHSAGAECTSGPIQLTNQIFVWNLDLRSRLEVRPTSSDHVFEQNRLL